MLKKLGLNVLNAFAECFFELVEVFFVEENLVFLVFIFPDTLAFGDGDVEVLLRLCCFDIEEIGAFAGPYPFGEELVFVPVGFQGYSLLYVK